MNINDTIKQLKEERDLKTDVIRANQREVEQLNQAIAALEGRLPSSSTVAEANLPEIPDIIETAARSLADEHKKANLPGECVFDNKKLVAKAVELYPAPTTADKIKRGIYNAVKSLIEKKKKFVRQPGGYSLAP